MSLCEFCGGEIPPKPKKSGTRKRYCSLECKHAASRYRERHGEGKCRYDIRRRLYTLLRNGKGDKAMREIGCSVQFLRRHLESQFKGGMTWDNYGEVWELDHIQPLAQFDLGDPVQASKAAHWSNIRPLFKSQNAAKGMGIERCQPEMPLVMV